MSWNWSKFEEAESKEYPETGTVTISTAEYRDLVRLVSDLRCAGQKEHDDWYEEKNKREALEKKLEAAELSLNQLNDWMDSEDGLRAKFKLWRVEQLDKEKEE